MCCFPAGAFGLSGFTASLRFGPSSNGLFSSVSLIKYWRSWRELQRNCNWSSQAHRIYNSSFADLQTCSMGEQNNLSRSQSWSPGWKFLNFSPLVHFHGIWMIISTYTISQRQCGSGQGRWRAWRKPCQQILLADGFFFKFGLCFLGGDIGGKRAPWKQGMAARKQMKGAAWAGTAASEMLCVIAAWAELCL